RRAAHWTARRARAPHRAPDRALRRSRRGGRRARAVLTRRQTMTHRMFMAAGAAGPLVAAARGPWGGLAQGKSTLDAVKERGTLRIGAAQAEPWFFKDPATQQWSGFGVALGKALADSMGVKLEIVEVTWGNAIAALQGNRIDLMAVLDATPERQQAADFPKSPLLYYALAVLVRDGLDVKTWDDLNRKDLTIAVTQGTSIDAHVTKIAPNATILRFPSNAETIAAFQSGRAD